VALEPARADRQYGQAQPACPRGRPGHPHDKPGEHDIPLPVAHRHPEYSLLDLDIRRAEAGDDDR
jgi:hypothetical protein